MKIALECKKIRRTGLVPAFLAGGAAAAALPIINTAVRTDTFAAMEGTPASILLDANSQMLAMLNLLLLTAGACILYHIEYADHALLKMQSLPARESGLFFGKLCLLIPLFLIVAVLETAALYYCGMRYLDGDAALFAEFLKSLGFSFLLTLPAAVLSLMIASVCRNMWNSLGICILCIFMATMLPTDNFIASLFPYALPFRVLPGVSADHVLRYCTAALCETGAVCMAEIIYLKIRRLSV